MTFSSSVMCGKRLNRWNTMPMWARWAAIAFSGGASRWAPCSTQPISSPSTRTSPALTTSSAFTHRSNVDLPEPFGPMRHVTSPGRTVKSIF